jgi:hypothetical protein
MKKFKNLFSSLVEGKFYRRENHKLKKKYREIDSKKKRRDGQPKTKRCNCDRCQKGRQCRMNRHLSEGDESFLLETIVKRGDKYVILSKKGKTLGTYDSHGAAVKRLKQIEYFKSLDENF